MIRPRHRTKPRLGARIDWNHPSSNGIVACWLLNEFGGLRAYDLSGHNNHGTLTNGAVFSPGRNGGSVVHFDGTDDFISISDSSSLSLSSTDFSSWGWVKIHASADYGAWGQPLGSGESFSVRVRAASGDVTVRTYDGTDFAEANKFLTVPINAWMWIYIEFEKSSGQIKVDVNNSGVFATANLPGTITDTADGWRISYSGSGSGVLNGQVDHVVIAKRRLTKAERDLLYRDPYAFIQPVPVRHARFVQTSSGVWVPTGMLLGI